MILECFEIPQITNTLGRGGGIKNKFSYNRHENAVSRFLNTKIIYNELHLHRSRTQYNVIVLLALNHFGQHEQSSSFFFQNEEIFVQLDRLDKLDRITHA